MNLRKLILKFLIAFSLISASILFFSLLAINTYTIKNRENLESLYLESTFEIYKNDLVGLMLIEDKETLSSLLQEISQKRLVDITVSTEAFMLSTTDKNILDSSIFTVSNGTSKIGDVFLKLKERRNLFNSSKEIFFLIFLQIIVFLIGYYFVTNQFQTKIAKPIVMLTNAKFNDNLNSFNMPDDAIEEVHKLATSIQNLYKEIVENEKNKTIALITRQVAHDIRSPLSALAMILSTLNEISEDKRILIRSAVQRINDIANDLLSKGKTAQNSDADINIFYTRNSNQNSDDCMLIPTIDALISEKRIQIRDKINLEIEYDSQKCFDAFIKINTKDISRVLSNLINNSIESFDEKGGKISVTVQQDDLSTLVIIKDNGKGMPREILEKLGKLSISYGKQNSESGSGLGFMHAKNIIEKNNGVLKIHSTLNKGTEVKIIIPKSQTPDWFANSLNITKKCKIFCLDDDYSIHQVWKRKFEFYTNKFANIKIFNYTSIKEFKESVAGLQNQKDILYLIDQEYIDQNENGLQIIEDLQIADKSILVTSRFDDDEIVAKCIKLGVKLLPKSMSGSIPIILK